MNEPPLHPGARLRSLLAQSDITVLPGVHDALSARLAVLAGFSAIAAGGNAATGTLLGAPDMGQLGEVRLFLMAALLTADELHDVRARLAQAQGELGRLQSDQARQEARGPSPKEPAAGHHAAHALDAAAQRIEALADALADPA